MTFLLSLARAKLPLPVALLVVLILSVGMLGQSAGRAKAERRATAAEAALGISRAALNTCHTDVSTLKAAQKVQNEAVAALKAEGDARVAQSAKATQAARFVAESYRREAGRILSARPKGGDACSSADALIAEVAG